MLETILPFKALPTFRGELLVSGSVYILGVAKTLSSQCVNNINSFLSRGSVFDFTISTGFPVLRRA